MRTLHDHSFDGAFSGPRTGPLPPVWPTHDDLPYAKRPRRGPVIAAIVALALLAGAGLGWALASGGDDDGGRERTAPPTTTAPDRLATTVAKAAPTTAAATPKPRPAPTTVAPKPTPTTAAPKAPAKAPAPHRAVYRNGKLYLVGAVPDATTRAELVAKAVAVVGKPNVIDQYVIDPRAAKVTDGKVVVDQRFLFPLGSATLDPSYSNVLELGSIVMRQNPQVTMVINGYTDSTGSDAVNLRLSQDRANAVVSYYAARGINPARFKAIGHGEADPAASNDTEAGRAQNRRIEVTLLHLIG